MADADAQNGRKVAENEQPKPRKRKVSKDGKETAALPTPPDGGWGWVVVLGSFIIHVIADGVAYSFGIFYIEFLDYFGSGRGETGWIGSMMIGITWGSGPLASALTNRYGCRAVTIVGSVMACAGYVLSIFAPNIYFMYFSYGILAGVGLGLIYLPAIVSVTYYFEERRAFATGLAVCGSGIGTFAFAPLTKALVEAYTWKGASLILGGILLNCIVCGALFRPLEPDAVPDEEEEAEDTEKVNGNGTVPNGYVRSESVGADPRVPLIDGQPKSASTHNLRPFTSSPAVNRGGTPERQLRRHQSEDLLHKVQLVQHQRSHSGDKGPIYRKDVFYTASLHNIPAYRSNPDMYSASMRSLPTYDEDEKNCCECSPEIKDAFRQMTDFSLLKNPVFLMFAISNFFTSIGFTVPYMFLPDRAKLLGLSPENGAFLISVIGMANTIGRVVFGWLSDRPFVNRLMLYNTALTLCGLCTSLSVFCTDFSWLAAYSACFGCFLGVYVSLTSVVLVDLLGLDCLTNSFGLTLLFQGVAGVIGPPIAGWLYDVTGDYDISFYVMGVIIGVSGLMLYVLPCMRRRQEAKQALTQHDVDMGCIPENTTDPTSPRPHANTVV